MELRIQPLVTQLYLQTLARLSFLSCDLPTEATLCITLEATLGFTSARCHAGYSLSFPTAYKTSTSAGSAGPRTARGLKRLVSPRLRQWQEQNRGWSHRAATVHTAKGMGPAPVDGRPRLLALRQTLQ